MPTVAIASEFLDAFARIPRAQQRKVREFTEKFRTNPKGPGINYEKIHAVKDDKVRTVRIDQKYRAVILHPPEGDVYVLVWVDNHDEAMDWAGKRTLRGQPGHRLAPGLQRQRGRGSRRPAEEDQGAGPARRLRRRRAAVLRRARRHCCRPCGR